MTLNDFLFFFREGWHHIISPGALDHILFIAALTVVYLPSQWKKILILVTAFTLGHGITLFLSVLDILRLPDRLVEFLIPCTIVITAAVNLWQRDFSRSNLRVNYFLAFFFGLIHGMGYANAIRFSLAKEQSLGWGLFSFNAGLEIGQIFVVLSILLIGHFVTRMPAVDRLKWVRILSIFVLIVALEMVRKRIPFTD